MTETAITLDMQTDASDLNGDIAVAVHELGRRFGEWVALDGLSLTLGRGDILVLLGPNGAGKTTTVRLLNGILQPDTGWSRVLGFDPAADGDAVRARTGVLTENAGLDDRLTARENLAVAAAMRRLRGPSVDRRIVDLLERFGVADLADRSTRGFSTGQRKRIALARALLHDPEVLFLDEPTSGLDPAATREVTTLIGSLAAERGRTIILCTHFLGEAGRLPAKMAVLDRGRLVALGRPETIAAGLWSGVRVELELDRPADAEHHALLRTVPGVNDVSTTDGGASLVVDDRRVVAGIVAALVGRGIDVLGATAVKPSLEEVYFEIQRRHLARTSTDDSDGPDGPGRGFSEAGDVA